MIANLRAQRRWVASAGSDESAERPVEVRSSEVLAVKVLDVGRRHP
jgi:hypothetical protein